MKGQQVEADAISRLYVSVARSVAASFLLRQNVAGSWNSHWVLGRACVSLVNAKGTHGSASLHKPNNPINTLAMRIITISATG
jgi:hypothetical protein